MSDSLQSLLSDPAYHPSAIVPAKSILDDYPTLTENRLRYIIQMRAQNGAQACGAILKVGNSICVNKVRFCIWFADHHREMEALETPLRAG